MKPFITMLALCVLLFSLPARAQSRPEPVGAVFCTVVAMVAGSIAALMFSPFVGHDDGNAVVGATMIAVGGTSLGFGVSLTVPMSHATVRASLSGVTLRW